MILYGFVPEWVDLMHGFVPEWDVECTALCLAVCVCVTLHGFGP